MHTCDACGESFETLSELRIAHEPCEVAEQQRRYEAAVEHLRDERGLAIGDRCRVIASGAEVEIVDIEPGEGEEDPTVVWVPAGSDDDPDNRQRSGLNEVV